MKQLIEPYAARMLTSNFTIGTVRAFHNVKHWAFKKPHKINAYLKIDDPFSHLLVQVIPDFIKRYDVEVKLKPVCFFPSEYYPDLAGWARNANHDCFMLAQIYNLHFPDYLPQFNSTEFDFYLSELIKLANSDKTDWEQVNHVFARYRSGQCSRRQIATTKFERHCAQRNWRDKGHYLTALLEYDGENYWGLDRLDHLEMRLIDLRANRGMAWVKYNRTYSRMKNARVAHFKHPVTLYFSFRSPYSYIALVLAERLSKRRDVPLVLKPVPPMVTRGLKVPRNKKFYIFKDAAREARKHEIDYGFVIDPLGAGVKRLHAVWPYALAEGQELQFAMASMKAIYADGIRVASDEGLKRVVLRSRLDAEKAFWHVNKDYSKPWLDTNLEELNSLGFWGVPVFSYQGKAFWGQDRLGFIDEMIR